MFPPGRPMLWGTFRHGATEYPVHVHVVPAGSPEVTAMRGFRDALRADPRLRRRYAVLKRAIVAGGPADPVAFTKAKHHWIAATLAQLGLAGYQPRPLYQDDPDPTAPPARMTANAESSSNMVRTRTAAVGTARASSRVASMPLRSGICRSMTTTSGRWRTASRIAA